jgi:hypothetical protein
MVNIVTLTEKVKYFIFSYFDISTNLHIQLKVLNEGGLKLIKDHDQKIYDFKVNSSKAFYKIHQVKVSNRFLSTYPIIISLVTDNDIEISEPEYTNKICSYKVSLRNGNVGYISTESITFLSRASTYKLAFESTETSDINMFLFSLIYLVNRIKSEP